MNFDSASSKRTVSPTVNYIYLRLGQLLIEIHAYDYRFPQVFLFHAIIFILFYR